MKKEYKINPDYILTFATMMKMHYDADICRFKLDDAIKFLSDFIDSGIENIIINTKKTLKDVIIINTKKTLKDVNSICLEEFLIKNKILVVDVEDLISQITTIGEDRFEWFGGDRVER